ncbi:MAG: TonB-dependent receptor [Pseudomonadota bacterium]
MSDQLKKAVRPNRNLSRLCIALATLTTQAYPAFAQSQGVLEEVIVTAQKRSESAQGVPISITALSGDAVEKQNILSATDLEKFTPGLRIPQQDSAKTFINIRGVGSKKFDVGSSGSVGVFTDEVYLPRFSGADIGFLDIERVEVLKGPQGTLFGRNTIAGAISSWTRKPSFESEGFLEGGVSNKSSYLVRGAVNGTLSDAIAARVSFGQQDTGGFQTNTLTGSTDDRSTTTARLQLSWDVDETLNLLTFLQYNNRQQDALLQRSFAATEDSQQIFPLLARPGLEVFDNGDRRDYPLSSDGDFEYDTWMGYVRAEKEFDDFQLVSLTSYIQGDGLTLVDFDLTEAEVGTSLFDEDYDTFSQEFRVVGDQWIIGAYYFLDDAYSDYEFTWFQDSIFGFFGQDGLRQNGPIDIETEAYALFGEYQLDLSDKWTLKLGGRYSIDQIEFERIGFSIPPGQSEPIVDYTFSDSERWTSFDPKISFTYQLTEDAIAFASYNEGYKAGGTQFTATNIIVAMQTFDPEELSSYELGFKSELLDRTLRINGSLFYYEYEDLQVQTVNVNLTDGIPVAFTSNAAESDIKGLELDLTWLPSQGLSVRLAYAYLDSQYNEFFGPAGQDFSGNPLPVSPEHTVIATLEYATPVAGGWLLDLGTDWTWTDEFNFEPDTNDPFTAQDAYAIGSVRASLLSPSEQWLLSLFINNVTDEDYFANKNRRETEVIGLPAEGRRYGLRASYRF